MDMIKSHEAFVDYMPEKVIIWGTSHWGRQTFRWLQEKKMEHIVIFFVDVNPLLHNSLLFGRKILSPSCLGEFEDASVILSAMLWNQMYEMYCKIGCRNPLYIAVNNMLNIIGLSEGVREFKYSTDEINSLYLFSDAYTKSMINLYDSFGRPCCCTTTILPILTALQNQDLLMSVSKPIGYWETVETKLDCFDSFTLIDGGAYIGDSLQTITQSTKSSLAHAYCFEPDRTNVERLRRFIDGEGLNSVVSVFSMGLGEQNTTVGISKPGTTGANLIESADGTTPIVTIDSLSLKVTGKLCIKMDIEGFELAALRGATETIRKYKPELAICVYHKEGDVYEIPAFIQSIVPEYNCILRGSWHMVCTASVERYRK